MRHNVPANQGNLHARFGGTALPVFCDRTGRGAADAVRALPQPPRGQYTTPRARCQIGANPQAAHASAPKGRMMAGPKGMTCPCRLQCAQTPSKAHHGATEGPYACNSLKIHKVYPSFRRNSQPLYAAAPAASSAADPLRQTRCCGGRRVPPLTQAMRC